MNAVLQNAWLYTNTRCIFHICNRRKQDVWTAFFWKPVLPATIQAFVKCDGLGRDWGCNEDVNQNDSSPKQEREKEEARLASLPPLLFILSFQFDCCDTSVLPLYSNYIITVLGLFPLEQKLGQLFMYFSSLKLWCLRRGLTSRCSSVKITGSATNTRLDSLVMEADRMWELTVSERLRLLMSPIPLSVAFSVLRNWPRCL